MQAITTIGLDIAKSVFQVHGVDAQGNVIFRRQLKRRYVLSFFQKLPPCLVGIEACATSHYWSRELQALGHKVRLMPPAYVKPYVKRQKNDAADAEAICETVGRPNMRFVETKTPGQQGCPSSHASGPSFTSCSANDLHRRYLNQTRSPAAGDACHRGLTLIESCIHTTFFINALVMSSPGCQRGPQVKLPLCGSELPPRLQDRPRRHRIEAAGARATVPADRRTG
jgi:hypothetical protein